MLTVSNSSSPFTSVNLRNVYFGSRPQRTQSIYTLGTDKPTVTEIMLEDAAKSNPNYWSPFQYLDHMGTDIDVCNAARVTSAKHVDDFVVGGYNGNFDDPRDSDYWKFPLGDPNTRLINYLATHHHTSPFYHQMVSVRIVCPIPIARQFFKHSVGFAFNEVSRRMDDSEPCFFLPSGIRSKSSSRKQGSSDVLVSCSDQILACMIRGYNDAAFVYRSMINEGCCPEQARFVLPQGMMTTFVATGSLYAWWHFYHLRVAMDAQEEIRYYADCVNVLMERLFPTAWYALNTKGEVKTENMTVGMVTHDSA